MAGVVLLAMVGCGGGGDDDSAGVCESCMTDLAVELCLDECTDDCDRCRGCGGGLYCTLFLGGNGLRCAIDDPIEDTCCIGDQRVDCETGERI